MSSSLIRLLFKPSLVHSACMAWHFRSSTQNRNNNSNGNAQTPNARNKTTDQPLFSYAMHHPPLLLSSHHHMYIYLDPSDPSLIITARTKRPTKHESDPPRTPPHSPEYAEVSYRDCTVCAYQRHLHLNPRSLLDRRCSSLLLGGRRSICVEHPY